MSSIRFAALDVYKGPDAPKAAPAALLAENQNAAASAQPNLDVESRPGNPSTTAPQIHAQANLEMNPPPDGLMRRDISPDHPYVTAKNAPAHDKVALAPAQRQSPFMRPTA